MWRRLLRWWREKIWWRITGHVANRQIEPGGKKRDEAEEQLARILFETGIRPDAVSATTMNGGPCFLVTHQGATEAFIHHTYTQAADKAIEWLKGDGQSIAAKKDERAPVMNRKQRRGYKRRHRRKATR
jgi:hypothetical protein